MVSMRETPGPLPGPVRRFEDERLITGEGRFVADLAPPDSLVAWFVRSPFARGELTGVDVSMARDMPGVVAIYTAADLDLPEVPSQHPAVPITMARPMLARDRVTFVGEPVAIVIAESAAEAEDAAGMVFIGVEPTDAVVTLDDALRDELIVHPEAGTNVAFQQHSTYGSELPPGLTEVSVTVENPRLAPSPIETMSRSSATINRPSNPPERTSASNFALSAAVVGTGRR